MVYNGQSIWLATGVRTPFIGVDGAFAHRDSLALSVPVVQAMAERSSGPIDFGVWGAVIPNLAYANLAREVWLEARLDPHVPTLTTVMQCSTSMVGVFEAAGILRRSQAALALVGGVESMSRIQIGLGQNLSDWLRRVTQARSIAQRMRLLRKLCPSDIRLFVPKIQNRVTGRSMGELLSSTTMRILSRRWTCLPSSATTTGSWFQTCVRAHDLCDAHDRVASETLLENWIDEAEKRTWFLFEASRAGESPRSDPTLIETD